MPDLPVGIVTFLFTDIEGSTQLLQRLGDDRYAHVLMECRQLLRTVFQRWEGHEVDTQGDAFFIVFARATSAVSAAVEVQQRLAIHSWPAGVTLRVRIGLHTGEPFVISEGYVGIDVHRAARIMSAGHGGQVLISQKTRDLVAHKLSDVDMRDVGEHHLKDLSAPEHLFQLVISGLPCDFPPLRTDESFLHKIPALSPSPHAAGGTPLSQESQLPLEGHQTNPIYIVRWSPDRRYIAAGGSGRAIEVWESDKGWLSFDYHGHAGAVITLVWSPDGTRIASASFDRTIHVWSAVPAVDSTIKRTITAYAGHPNLTYALAWSPNGTLIVSSSGGGPDTTLHVWNAATGHDLFTYSAHKSWVRAIKWSPDGRFIASGSSKEVQVWSAVTGQKLSAHHGHQGWVRAIAWSPDGKTIASASEDKTIQLWAASTGRVLVTYHDHAAWINTVAWSPDGKQIASIDRDNTVHIWDTASGKNISISRLQAGAVYAIAWLPDGKHIALASSDKAVKVMRVG